MPLNSSKSATPSTPRILNSKEPLLKDLVPAMTPPVSSGECFVAISLSESNALGNMLTLTLVMLGYSVFFQGISVRVAISPSNGLRVGLPDEIVGAGLLPSDKPLDNQLRCQV